MEQEYKYMVCTRCFTFNHAPYIVDAMNGFTMQETSFPVITLIVDDASQDGEPDVIRQYLVENFQAPYSTEETDDYYLICANHTTNSNCTFVVFLLKYNHYSIRKPKMPYLSKWLDNAKYIALCEGDDYWIHPRKLQLQVDYFESHPEVGLLHAKAKVYNQENHCFRGTCGEQNGDFERILLKNPIVTLTTCYRTSLFQKYEGERKKWGVKGWKMGDYPTWIWMSKRAGVHFMKDVVAVYREQNNSVTHSGGLENKLAFIDSTVDIRLFFCDYYKLPQKTKKQVLYNAFLSKAANCLARQEKIQAEAYLKKLTILDRWNLKLRFWFHDVRHILNKQKDA